MPYEVLVRFVQDVQAEAEWVPMLKSYESLEQDDQGREVRGQLTTNILGLVEDTYLMTYTYGPDRMNYELPEPTKLQKVQKGSYVARDNNDGSSTFQIILDTENTVPAPALVRKRAAAKVSDMIMKAAKKYVESNRAKYE